jgi:pimeloyl-ACP methyl ester carboxylesterase
MLFAKKNVNRYENEIDNLKEKGSKLTREGVIAALGGMRDRDDQIEFLKKLEIPVFFIIGKQDSRIPFNKVITQLEAPQNCEALIVDDVGHMGFIEAEDLTYSAVEHFIERNA